MLENENEKLYNKTRNVGQFNVENAKTNIYSVYEKLKEELQETKPYRLLISSYGFESPIMTEKFKKVIFGENLSEKKCLVIPYADKNPKNAFEEIKQHLIDFGFDGDNILMVKEFSDLLISFPDYVYVSGGDPFLLLKTINDLDLREFLIECIKEKRATYIGISAGADILTKSIEYVTLFEDNNVIKNDDFSALSLIDEGVLCHYDHRSYSLLKACKEISGEEFLTLNDDQLIEIKDGSWQYIGDEL